MSDSGTIDLEIRRATHDDYEGVAAFTETLWEAHGGDYLHRIYHDWLEDDDEPKKTFLAEHDGDVAGIVQAVMLSDDEAWFQGMRVNPDYQRKGVSQRLNEATFEWAREQGATVGRVMIFSWNAASLAAARKSGFEPITEFRFAKPVPEDRVLDRRVSSDSELAWQYWADSDARDHLSGLALAPEESWALRELEPEDFEAFADETAVFAVETATDTEPAASGVAYRTRTIERSGDDGEDSLLAEYGVAAWDDVDAARALWTAIAQDAASIGADETRVLIPETARTVSDATYAGAPIADEPDFVLGIDLTS